MVAASVGVSSVDASSSVGTSSFAAIEMLLVLLSAVMFCETSLLLALGTIFGGIRIERTRAESSSYIAINIVTILKTTKTRTEKNKEMN